jgi:hypothetical protein
MESPEDKVRASKEYKAAKEKGVDVEALIADAMNTPRYQKFKSPATRESILKSVIIPAKKQMSGDPFDEELMVIAYHDRYGNDPKFATKFVALRKNKQFCNVSIYDVNSLQVPCKCRVVGVSKTDEYGTTVYPMDNGISKVEDITFDKIAIALNKVAITPGDTQKIEDLLIDGKKSETRAFKTSIYNVSPHDIWEENEQTGKSRVVAHHPPMMGDERNPAVMHPFLKFELGSPERFIVSAVIYQQRYGNPTIQIEDFDAFLEDAMALESSAEQMELLRSCVIDRDVFVVMDVYQKKPGKDNTQYINGSCSFIMEISDDKSLTDTRETLQTEEPSPSPSPSGHVENPFVEALVKASIPLDTDPKWIPVAKAREIASIGADVSDNMVQEMVKRASQVWNERKKV